MKLRCALMVAFALGSSGTVHGQGAMILAPGQQATIPAGTTKFTPLDPSQIPDSPLGTMIRFGRVVFVDTQRYAKDYVGNGLNCVNCHLDAGRAPDSAPMWAAYVVYPLFRSVNDQVNTFNLMLEYCFRYPMNGRMPPADRPVVTGLIAYSFWLATGAPVGTQLAGRGYRALPEPQQVPDATRGLTVFSSRCGACHGEDGGGLKAAGTWTFPAVWGNDSYGAGAGMYKVPIAAAFIKAKMPYGQGESLSDQQAWDVAAYINSKPRPRDPGPVR